jgi:hypothetical protein
MSCSQALKFLNTVTDNKKRTNILIIVKRSQIFGIGYKKYSKLCRVKKGN